MKKIMSLIAITAIILNTSTYAQTKKEVTDLPDISVIGNFIGTHTDSKKRFDVKEIEFSFQHYLYPSVKADVFAALHKEESGKRNFELEEAYITFSDLYNVLVPNSTTNLGLGAIVGSKLLNIGKTNPLHPEQWDFVDRPLVLKNFLGNEEGLSAEGGQLMYLLPVPFFSQIELGYWTANTHAEETGEAELHSGIEYKNRLFTGRLWNSVPLSETQEFEFGLSYLLGNASASSSNDKQNVMGIDVTYTKEISTDQFMKLQSELYHAKYGEEGERKNQKGAFISGLYQWNPYYQTGIRFGTLGKHGGEGNTKNQWSLMVTRKLTDTSKLRFQYNTGKNIDDTITVQFVFGMGPHAHVLQ